MQAILASYTKPSLNFLSPYALGAQEARNPMYWNPVHASALNEKKIVSVPLEDTLPDPLRPEAPAAVPARILEQQWSNILAALGVLKEQYTYIWLEIHSWYSLDRLVTSARP